MTRPDPHTGYAPANGLQLYYELHGTGQPLVLLHGAYMTIELMGPLVPALAQTRQVIAVELQGHGHTADLDRPLTYEALADDVGALLGHLGVEQTDVFGFSLGAGVALQVAVRHPDAVRKLVVASGSYRSDGLYPEVLAQLEHTTPEVFIGTPWHNAYLRVAPRPEDFPALVAKLTQLDRAPQAWSPEAIRDITAPTLVVIGDADVVRPEHALELFRLLGGGVPGDLAGLTGAQLAVLPGTTHLGVIQRGDWLQPMIEDFLDHPLPGTPSEKMAPSL